MNATMANAMYINITSIWNTKVQAYILLLSLIAAINESLVCNHKSTKTMTVNSISSMFVFLKYLKAKIKKSMKLHEYITHGCIGVLWIFLISFGVGMEDRQLRNRCSNHQNAYIVMSICGGTLAIFQLCTTVHYWIKLSCRYSFFILLIQSNLTLFAYVGLSVGTSYAYMHLMLNVFFSRFDCRDVYEEEKWIFSRLFQSFVIIASIICFVETLVSIYKCYRFWVSQYMTWMNIVKRENILMSLKQHKKTDEVALNFDDNSNKYLLSVHSMNLANFIEKWINMMNDDVTERLSNEALDLSGETGLHKNQLSQRDFNELKQYSHMNDPDEMISYVAIKRFLYSLYFDKKKLTNELYTNDIMLSSIKFYTLALLMPAGLIAISKIFGYQNSFGTGVDLFKTYMLTAGYVFSHFKENIEFLYLMLAYRVFNVGDMLEIDEDLYRVKEISSVHICLEGGNTMNVPTEKLMKSSIINISKQSLSESMNIKVPSVLEEDDDSFKEILEEYNALYPFDIDVNGSRIGYIEMTDDSKLMNCHWTYQFEVFDRSHFKQVQCRLRNFIVKKIQHKISESLIFKAMCEGGAFNSKANRFNFVDKN